MKTPGPWCKETMKNCKTAARHGARRPPQARAQGCSRSLGCEVKSPTHHARLTVGLQVGRKGADKVVFKSIQNLELYAKRRNSCFNNRILIFLLPLGSNTQHCKLEIPVGQLHTGREGFLALLILPLFWCTGGLFVFLVKQIYSVTPAYYLFGSILSYEA